MVWCGGPCGVVWCGVEGVSVRDQVQRCYMSMQLTMDCRSSKVILRPSIFL